jgi:RNA polymerase sigma factor (sigma-70 family)
MSPTLIVFSFALPILIWALHDLAVLGMAFRAAAPGSTMQVTLSSRASLHYQAADGSPRAERPDPAEAEPARPAELDFDAFVRLTYKEVYKIAVSSAESTDGVWDAVNEAYADLQEQWPEHSAKGLDHLRSYVLRAVSHRRIDEIRRETRATRALGKYLLDPTTECGSAPSEADLAPLHGALREALRTVLDETRKDTHRRIIGLRINTDMTAGEIARETRTSERTVHRVIKRAADEVGARVRRDHPELENLIRSEVRRRLPRPRRKSSHDKEVDQ